MVGNRNVPSCWNDESFWTFSMGHAFAMTGKYLLLVFKETPNV